MDGIKYPKRETEAEVQAMLWIAFRDRDIDARLEVIGNLGGRRHKFDIVVFRDKVPQVIIECKSWSKHYSKERLYQLSKNTYQIRKYERYGLPVFICGRPEFIKTTLDNVIESLREKDYEPVPEGGENA